MRTSRTRRTSRLLTIPYNQEDRRNPDIPQQQAEVAHFHLGGILPPCPRQGQPFTAGQGQPRAAWQIARRPHEATNITVANFLFTLTAQDVRQEIARNGHRLFASEAAFKDDSEVSLAQLAMRCRDTNSRRGSVDFQFMVSLMSFSFRCARLVHSFMKVFEATNRYIIYVSLSGWENVNIAALWREHLATVPEAPCLRTLQNWYSRGSKLMRLAAGGRAVLSPYMSLNF